MTESVYLSTKPPNGNATAAPSAKTNLYIPTRHPHRPIPASRRLHNRRGFSCRRCFCLTCFWSIIILIVILLLAAIAAAVLNKLYHPQPPSFSVTSLKISTFNLTTNPSDETTRLTTRFNLTISTRNKNSKKITFLYDPMSISVYSNSVKLCNGSFTSFTSSPDPIFVIHSEMGLNSQLLDKEEVNSLKRKNGLPMEIVMETTVTVKMEKMKFKKVGIRVKCGGIHGVVTNGRTNKPAVVNTDKAKCNVDFRIKIWRFSF